MVFRSIHYGRCIVPGNDLGATNFIDYFSCEFANGNRYAHLAPDSNG
jgi:hypothetical protein